MTIYFLKGYKCLMQHLAFVVHLQVEGSNSKMKIRLLFSWIIWETLTEQWDNHHWLMRSSKHIRKLLRFKKSLLKGWRWKMQAYKSQKRSIKAREEVFRLTMKMIGGREVISLLMCQLLLKLLPLNLGLYKNLLQWYRKNQLLKRR